MQTRIALVVLLVVVSVGTLSTPVSADDDWPRDCNEAPIVQEGTYSGEISSNRDTDALKVRLSRGNYLDMSISVPEKEGDFEIWTPDLFDGQEIGIRGLTNAGLDAKTNNVFGTEILPKPGKATWELWAKQDIEVVCFHLQDYRWETQYEWELTIERNKPDMTLYDVRQLEDEIASLQADLNEKNQEIDELNQELQNKSERIAKLKQQSGNVEIEVVVNPSNNQRNFIEGRNAVVQAESNKAEWSKFQVQYQGDSYPVDESGQAVILLSGTGAQQMTFVYGEIEETVSIEVQSRSDQQPSTATPTSDTETDSDGDGVPDSEDYAPRDPSIQEKSDLESNAPAAPGFGIGAGVIALISLVVIARWGRSTD